MAISKRLRFEVFKRDSFTCQYCGSKAPDVVLHADHVHPRAAGGKDSILNLITACLSCNLGKSDKLLSDDAVIAKKRDQLALLQERKEQIEMMMEWQFALHDLDAKTVDQLADKWQELLLGRQSVTETGKARLRGWIRKYSAPEVLAAMYATHGAYIEYDKKGEIVAASGDVAFKKIGSICHITRQEKEKPYLKDLYYIRKIAENRCEYFVPYQATDLLDTAFSWGADSDHLASIARGASSWSSWRNRTLDYVGELRQTAKNNGA